MPDALWAGLARFKAEKTFPAGYPPNIRTFWAPRDDLHGALAAVVGSAKKTLAISMYAYADKELDAIIRSKLLDAGVGVELSLDLSQSAGAAEAAILKNWADPKLNNSVAIGRSAKGAISHLKTCVIDDLYVIRGSTNWSTSGETLQDNELTVIRGGVIAAETRAELARVHAAMLAQEKKR